MKEPNEKCVDCGKDIFVNKNLDFPSHACKKCQGKIYADMFKKIGMED